MEKVQPIVSIIIPVYNAVETLPRCIDSLFAQTYQQFELIFVDDCSTDNSSMIIEHYVEKNINNNSSIRIKNVHHVKNRGVAAARNSGLEQATGEYIYYVDADDWIEPNAIECLVNEAIRTDADIVGCEWYLSFNKNERYMRQHDFPDRQKALKLIMCGVIRWNLWLFMARRSLYQTKEIRFIEGMNMGEDLMVMVKLFISAGRVSKLNVPLYHYGQSNSNSLTKTYSHEHILQVTSNVSEVKESLNNSNMKSLINPYLFFLELNIKLPLLITDDVVSYNHWLKLFPESNAYVMRNKQLSLRTRLLQWMAVKKHFTVIKLYYRYIFRLVYGVVYK
jgi:glycosyltransferase involved in cell wall biosynthesis